MSKVEEDLKYEDDSGYKGAKKMSIDDAMKADENDESLKKWKDALLAQAASAPKSDQHVVFDKLLIKSAGLPKRLEFTFEEVKKAQSEKKSLFTIKGGESFAIGYQYRVFNDIVMGLRVVMRVQKMGIAIAKGQTMMGCYAPQAAPHEYFLEEIDTPSSVISRGNYHTKAVFGDDDAGDGALGELEFTFRIEKDW
ncbi:Rho_GDI [Hexamita inflata]|uniref:Rho GDI n=2 Tax=Hexamita inflata TaxID=28002 RepID=A0AA86P0B2_9EUKA|nr:Rho GDI [Hexamita inflata]CAI9929459.1 Rho GDI [Hexamita inflata]